MKFPCLINLSKYLELLIIKTNFNPFLLNFKSPSPKSTTRSIKRKKLSFASAKSEQKSKLKPKKSKSVLNKRNVKNKRESYNRE